MEEKRLGQEPEAERRPAEQAVYERAALGPSAPEPSGKERDLILDAQQRAARDRKELRASGHGDHKGEEGLSFGALHPLMT